jgi:ubiquinone/menaquinone biosynthesis C-methylase UbiE
MSKNILDELHRDLRSESPSTLDFTRKAFQLLTPMNNPRILDIGCGEGKPTLELARLSQGEVFGLDTNQSLLDKLSMKIKEGGLSDRVHVVNRSMHNMDFPEESFDVIWSEGSIQFIGFERGIQEWRRFIKPEGFLVIHEMAWLRPDPPREIVDRWQTIFPGIRTVAEYCEQIPIYGYKNVGHFPLPEDYWWHEYYGPLEKKIQALREKYSQDQEVQKTLDREQHEVDLYKKYFKWYGSAFYLMQKCNTQRGKRWERRK